MCVRWVRCNCLRILFTRVWHRAAAAYTTITLINISIVNRFVYSVDLNAIICQQRAYFRLFVCLHACLTDWRTDWMLDYLTVWLILLEKCVRVCVLMGIMPVFCYTPFSCRSVAITLLHCNAIKVNKRSIWCVRLLWVILYILVPYLLQ